MSAAHVLLSSLQDRARCSAESCRAMLTELLTLCHYDELKSEIVGSGADTLLALASDDTLMTTDALEALLELLGVLMLSNHAARARLVRKGVLRVALDALSSYVAKKPSKKRNKIVKLALEIIDQWNCSSGSGSGSADECTPLECQEAIVANILRTLGSVCEDVNVLLHAAEVLGCMLERSSDIVECTVRLDGVATLLQLLLTEGEFMDVKRSVCEALLIMSDAPGLVQLLVSSNVIHALCVCLRTPIPSRDVESLAMRLLLRLTDEAQVYGQIIRNDMLPLVFEVVDRNCNLLEVAAPACTLLERLSHFARDCKLDLASYVQTPSCRSKVLLAAASSHVHVASLVRSVFQFFVHVSFNPVDLPLLVNSESIEGLLALYVQNGSVGSLAALSLDLVQIISSLSRSTIESLALQDDDTSLPSLFLCLRTHHENLRFASQVFAVLTKYWCTQAKSVHSITGFVGIAVDVLCRYAPTSLATCDEMMDIYNFVRVVLDSKDGVDVVLSCGGKALFESTSSVSKVTDALVVLLESAVCGTFERVVAAPPPVVVSQRIREGDDEYKAFVARILLRERSCQFKAFEFGALRPSASGSSIAMVLRGSSGADAAQDDTSGPATRHKGIAVSDSDDDGEGSSASDDNNDGSDACDRDAVDPSTDSGAMVEDDDAEAEAENDGNDDGSDGDGSEDDEDAIVDIALQLEEALGDAKEDLMDGCNDNEGVDAGMASTPLSEQTKRSPSKLLVDKGWSASIDFAQFEDRMHYYASPLGIQFPKHPSRATPGACLLDDHDGGSDATDLLTSCEPCRAPSPEAMSAFVEQANARRAVFLQSDPATRARLVYDSKSHFETLGGVVIASTGERPPPSNTKSEAYPYYVSDKCSGGGGASGGDTLTFDSCFESGNLARAVQIGEREYDLFLRRDYNTAGHMQWFYFAVSNVRPRANGATTVASAKYRFNIVNLCKPDSLFNQGLQPLVYSVRDAHERRRGWHRSGSDIYYFSNPFPRSAKYVGVTKAAASSGSGGGTGTSTITNDSDASQSTAPVETFFTLTFTLELANANDTYLIAHSYPYTLSDHVAHMERLACEPARSLKHILRRSVLCKTLSGKDCELLSISDFAANTVEQRARRAVVLSSRVHPGEAQASWMMRGIIDFLLGDSDAARVLRRVFLFLVVPMLNPDGVYFGNSRCSLAACDLNRIWHAPSAVYHPTIFHTKELLKQASAARGVALFCDLHGHSRKKNVFMYGCDTKKRSNPRARAFAKLFAAQQTARSYLSFPDCSFKISKSKETTARVVVANELKIAWCFTLEASFCGGSFGPLQDMHYNTRHMRQVGASLCETLLHASVSDSSVRERLAAIADDYSVNVPAYVDSLLCESGVASDAPGVSGPARESGLTTPRAKSKATTVGSSSSGAVRRTSDAASSGSSKLVRRKSSSSRPSKPPPAPGLSKAPRQDSRKLERKFSGSQGSQEQRASTLSERSAELRDSSADVASPRTYMFSADVCVPQQQDCGDAPPLCTKMSGKKLHNKKKKKVVKRAPPSVATMEQSACDKSLAESMPTLANRAREADAFLASGARGVCSSSSSGSGSTSGPQALTKSSTCSPCGKSPSGTHGGNSVTSLQLADSIPTVLWKPTGPALPGGALSPPEQPRENAGVILPPPVSELIARSPKARSTSVRFRGAGRQFAAVSPVQSKSLKEIMQRSESIQYVTYDHDLLNASTIAIRQRTSLSGSNNTLPARATKLAPAVAPSSYLSFPSVT